ncbi:hypothetical protein NUU61_008912 [Penicillium alfredii]|uniref:Uncharacterized protein n=1 Tax=Penicillium alfredii TaxID=1506179 RepID=A0A9W9EM17_9EURO|nr:uncharacterized protein NUU61_008912 [Penicillium alfredii]KAJ5084333.1 hypothetical protein NUU61_008912 [Penicillium alfredii]
MGISQSTPAKDETRRSNRLSKPFTKSLLSNTNPVPLACPEVEPPELATGLIGWQNPWVGSHIPSPSVETRTSGPKKRDIPPTLFESEVSENDSNLHSSCLYDQSPDPSSISPSSSVSPATRRASYQPECVSTSSRFSAPEQPRRSNSIQALPQRQRHAVYDSRIEDGTSSNTHFVVGNQRFSLTCRRSLLTRPGVATRRTTSAIRRVPSPIGEPESSIDDSAESTVLHWPLPPRRRPPLPVPPPARPSSPSDSRYTQLGALKLGSLRVVNGSASPCPSERIPLDQPYVPGPGLGLGGVEAMGPQGSLLEIPSGFDVKRSDDAPGSPFSFEKSPTIAVPSHAKSLFSGDPEDEGIGMSDDARTSDSGNSQLEKDSVDMGIGRQGSRSLNKSDSGYSSATSVRSFPHSRTRGSFDSQTSGSCSTDSPRNLWNSNDQSFSRPGEMVRQFSLREGPPGDKHWLHPTSTLWYDPSGSSTLFPSSLRARRSTLCAPRYTEYSAQHEPSFDSTHSAAVLPYPPSRRGQPDLMRGSSNGDWFPTSLLNDTHGSGYSPGLDMPSSYQQTSTDAQDQLRRSASEHRIHVPSDMWVSRVRSRGRSGGRVWSQKPGVDVPPLPTILSPDHPDGEEEVEGSFSEAHRGRSRSRNHNCHRRRLTKARPQTDVNL